MADQHDEPDQQPAKKSPAKKAPAKKAPAKKTPAKKTPAKKTPAKKAPPPQPALEAPAEVPALEPAPAHAALTAGPNPARKAAANAKESVRQADRAATGPVPVSREASIRLPLSIGLAAISFIALLLRRLRRG